MALHPQFPPRVVEGGGRGQFSDSHRELVQSILGLHVNAGGGVSQRDLCVEALEQLLVVVVEGVGGGGGERRRR